MKVNKKFFINTLIGFVIASLLLIFSSRDILQRLQLAGLDILFRYKKTTLVKSPIVIIEINDTNIAKVGRWPWDRSWHAAITKILKDLAEV